MEQGELAAQMIKAKQRAAAAAAAELKRRTVMRKVPCAVCIVTTRMISSHLIIERNLL